MGGLLLCAAWYPFCEMFVQNLSRNDGVVYLSINELEVTSLKMNGEWPFQKMN